MTRNTFWKFAVVALLFCSVGYLLASLQFSAPRVSRSAVFVGESVLQPPFLIFRTLEPHDAHGRVAMLALRPGENTRYISNLSCARVHYARGSGVCLVQEQSNDRAEYAAYVFDRRFSRQARIVLRGIPTRARVSPDGRRASITTYAEEESPAGERLATESIIIDVRSGRVLADVRDFQIDHDRLPPLTGPIDVSSVAFEPDGDRFFATISTATERHLVAGSVDAHRLTSIRSGVANEALSPDGRHLIIKRLIGERGFWQLAVIDLHTWAERDLNQGSRSVDDQVEWLDNDHVIYHDVSGETTAIWMLPIDGTNGPEVLVSGAFSATTQR